MLIAELTITHGAQIDPVAFFSPFRVQFEQSSKCTQCSKFAESCGLIIFDTIEAELDKLAK